MDPKFSSKESVHPAERAVKAWLTILISFVIICVSLIVPQGKAQRGDAAVAEFKQISGALSAARLSGEEENAAQLEKALAYLDSVAVSGLNSPGGADLSQTNQRLASLLSHTPPVGENYRLEKLGGTPAAYAMVANFGLGGPAAIRIYAGAAGHLALAARIDHTVQKDLFDSDLELFSVSRSDSVFVTVAGRTDDLSTGIFSAWRFDGNRVAALWNSDLLQQTTYEADENGLRLAYCSQVDEDRPSQCLKMSQDLYRFQDQEWKRIQTTDLPLPKSPAK
jgi:hypothetical protein